MRKISLRIGIAEMLVGAEREKKGEGVDYSAGVLFYKKTNDYVEKDEIIAELLRNSSKHIEEANSVMCVAYIISENKNENIKLIKDIHYERR
ncbi:MAG: hypothetical protein LE178_03715 [Endomicrobium sp.]|nr:hypothetical protein [Endomicrobium sp.]